MESQKYSLNLPRVDAEIYAEKDGEYSSWEINFVMSGPDARFNNARTIIDEMDLTVLVHNLEKALEQMKELGGKSFSGTHEKDIGRISGIDFSIFMPYRGKVTTCVTMRSKTYNFSRYLFTDDVVEWIQKLTKAPEIGKKMLEELKSL